MMRNESTVDPTTEERKTPVPTQGNNDNKRLALLEGNGRETKQHQFCGSQQPAAAVVTKKWTWTGVQVGTLCVCSLPTVSIVVFYFYFLKKKNNPQKNK
jgi:hypothetical protein